MSPRSREGDGAARSGDPRAKKTCRLVQKTRRLLDRRLYMGSFGYEREYARGSWLCYKHQKKLRIGLEIAGVLWRFQFEKENLQRTAVVCT